MSSYRESATPIFDEVDRRWRKPEGDDAVDEAGTDDAAPSMLSFATTPPAPSGRGRRAHAAPAPDGSSSTVLSLIAAARRESGPRHALRR